VTQDKNEGKYLEGGVKYEPLFFLSLDILLLWVYTHNRQLSKGRLSLIILNN